MILKNYSKLAFHQQGIALVIVLWMLALLTIIALSYSSMSRTETLLIKNSVYSAQARSLAERGIWLAVNDLLKPQDNRHFSQNSTAFNLQTSSDKKLTVFIQDESGKIDINKASRQLLLGMCQSLSDDFDRNNQLVDAIIDWRDRDDLTSINGAEDKDYAASGYSYGAKDGAFNSIGELLLVKGMTVVLYQKISPLITVHSMQSRVRLNTATTAVLNVLPGLSPDMINQVVNSRTNNETVIIDSILPDTLKSLVFTKGAGNIFSVHAEAKVKGIGANLRVILALKKNGKKPITVLDWQENAAIITKDSSLQENVLENELDI